MGITDREGVSVEWRPLIGRCLGVDPLGHPVEIFQPRLVSWELCLSACPERVDNEHHQLPSRAPGLIEVSCGLLCGLVSPYEIQSEKNRAQDNRGHVKLFHGRYTGISLRLTPELQKGHSLFYCLLDDWRKPQPQPDQTKN